MKITSPENLVPFLAYEIERQIGIRFKNQADLARISNVDPAVISKILNPEEEYSGLRAKTAGQLLHALGIKFDVPKFDGKKTKSECCFIQNQRIYLPDGLEYFKFIKIPVFTLENIPTDIKSVTKNKKIGNIIIDEASHVKKNSFLVYTKISNNDSSMSSMFVEDDLVLVDLTDKFFSEQNNDLFVVRMPWNNILIRYLSFFEEDGVSYAFLYGSNYPSIRPLIINMDKNYEGLMTEMIIGKVVGSFRKTKSPRSSLSPHSSILTNLGFTSSI